MRGGTREEESLASVGREVNIWRCPCVGLAGTAQLIIDSNMSVAILIFSAP